MQFLFVGERQSHQAVKIGATWQNGKLAAKQLHDALRALNIEPTEQLYCNLWTAPGVGPIADAPDLAYVRACYVRGLVIIGMGALVCAALSTHDIPHLQNSPPGSTRRDPQEGALYSARRKRVIRQHRRETQKGSTVMVQFYDFTRAERELVAAIVARAVAAGIYDDAATCDMDISAVYVHCPLRLTDLLAADRFNFGHDLAGIQRHINRQTGRLEDCFLPRFACPSVM